MSTTEAQLKSEIARLQASINQRKLQQQYHVPSNVYVNPNYNPPRKPARTYSHPSTSTGSDQVKDVILGGVAFKSSSRSLVRKDVSQSSSSPAPPPVRETPKPAFSRRSGHLIQSGRVYKSKPSRGRGRHAPRNMTLTNRHRPYQCARIGSTPPSIDYIYSARMAAKRAKYSEKPCPRFTSTGACSRGLTCMYQHDPDKVAICWSFLKGNCPKTNETCNLSHEPSPERTPLCIHFVSKGSCTRPNCPFPHVNVGPREGICRDFAVLGYCSKGLDCEHQHVRECPDFAEKGICTTRGCKLPHVIRANRKRKATDPQAASQSSTSAEAPVSTLTANDAKLGDDFISLTFNESDSSDEDNDSEDEEDDLSDEEMEDDSQSST